MTEEIKKLKGAVGPVLKIQEPPWAASVASNGDFQGPNSIQSHQSPIGSVMKLMGNSLSKLEDKGVPLASIPAREAKAKVPGFHIFEYWVHGGF